MKKYICVILILCMILLVFAGCRASSVDTIDVSVTTEDLIKTAPLVFLGRVKAEGAGWYRNAEEIHYYDNGNAMFNYWITPYTVEVIEVYKGDLKEAITELTVGTYNYRSPEETTVEGEETFYLKTGDTAVFCVSYNETDGCYKPIYSHKGVFFPGKTFKTYVSENNEINIADIDNVLKKAEINGTDQAAIAGEKVDIKAEHKKQAAEK